MRLQICGYAFCRQQDSMIAGKHVAVARQARLLCGSERRRLRASQMYYLMMSFTMGVHQQRSSSSSSVTAVVMRAAAGLGWSN